MAPKAVFDTSAILALIRAEPGWDRAAAALPGAVLCAVNAAELYSKLADWQMPPHEQARYHTVIEDIVVPLDNDLALRAGAFRRSTKAYGLSIADRACLALAQRLGVRAVTADKIWTKVEVGVEIEVIR